jgi:hypothetical protein
MMLVTAFFCWNQRDAWIPKKIDNSNGSEIFMW